MKRFQVQVPIYELTLHLVYGEYNKVRQLRNSLEFVQRFGTELTGEFSGVLSYRTHHFGLFFDQSRLTPEIIAHEVFHCTHRMLEYIGHELTTNSCEPHAYLCGWITDWMYKNLPYPTSRRPRRPTLPTKAKKQHVSIH